MTLAPDQLAAVRDLEQAWPGCRIVVIGAGALGFYYVMTWRQTEDLDLAVAVEIDEITGVASALEGWQPHPHKAHKFYAPGGVEIDLLPAGPEVLAAGSVTWPDGAVMNVAGLALALQHAASHTADDGGTVDVAPPHVVGYLKMDSYLDNPYLRERDLADLAHLLNEYVDEDCDRRFDEALGYDFELTPALLLGRDMGAIVEESHRVRIEEFDAAIGDPDTARHALMREQGPIGWHGDLNALARRWGAFLQGLGGHDPDEVEGND